MLPRELRLPATNRPVRKTVLSYPYFRAMVWPNNLPVSRFAITISKRVDKRATVRNRYRRIAFTQIQHSFPSFSHGLDIRISLNPTHIEEEAYKRMLSQALTDIQKQFGAKTDKT